MSRGAPQYRRFSLIATLEQATHQIAVRALGQQEQALTELRSRTGILLTAASLVASFLGALAIDRNGVALWTTLALLAFGLSVLLSIYVLLPKADWFSRWMPPRFTPCSTPFVPARMRSSAVSRTGPKLFDPRISRQSSG